MGVPLVAYSYRLPVQLDRATAAELPLTRLSTEGLTVNGAGSSYDGSIAESLSLTSIESKFVVRVTTCLSALYTEGRNMGLICNTNEGRQRSANT